MKNKNKSNTFSVDADSVKIPATLERANGGIQERARPATTLTQQAEANAAASTAGKCQKEKPTRVPVCFNVVLSGNGYDYLGP